ncbi:hypothetical protein [Streptomyces sp. NPDC058294]|uniref:hypothetical protein n=1 Tax=Streptomyces sp. NPDC058294 TaxID=3346430 RepID=UPI0036E2E12C
MLSGLCAGAGAGAGAVLAPGPAAAAPAPVAAPGTAVAVPGTAVASAPSTAVPVPEVVPPPVAAPAPEADLSLHGSAVLDADQVGCADDPAQRGIRRRHGRHHPAALAGKEPAAGCLRADERTVLCATGTPAADAAAEAAAEQLHVPVRLAEPAPEVTLDIDTGWPGSAVDANPSNDRPTALVPATGDSYAF